MDTLVKSLKLRQKDTQDILFFIEYLVKANKNLKLTSIKSKPQWFRNHVEDCVWAYSFYKELGVNYFIDCGSGNGLPGIIFGILSRTSFLLCDTDKRKAEFLRILIYKLNLRGEVFDESILDFNPEYSDKICYIYRGLGPDEVLKKNFEKNENQYHIRFISGKQEKVFRNSELREYNLSDGSSRFLEIYIPKG